MQFDLFNAALLDFPIWRCDTTQKRGGASGKGYANEKLALKSFQVMVRGKMEITSDKIALR